VTPELAARLEAAGIQKAAEGRDYCMFVRENCLALVQASAGEFTSLGSSGIMTEKGLAYLVWQDGVAMLSSHGSQIAADSDQVQAIRKFSDDLKKTIWPPDEPR